MVSYDLELGDFNLPQQRNLEDIRIRQIDKRLHIVRYALESILPVYLMLDRKLKGLQSEVSVLEGERLKLTQGQMIFDDQVEF